VVGGWLFSAIGGVPTNGFNLWSILVAFIGAVILLYIVKAVQTRQV
jgi:uncharacterized membrane protein YeaQ/YmgE (transglycosylase-associated protein family)